MNENNINKYKIIGHNIGKFRRQKNISQNELANRLNISKSYLSKIEAPNCNKSFSLDVLFSISEELGIKLVLFFEGVD